jgi:hypothetical protein
MSNLYRGPSIDASYQVSVHLAKGFQRKRLKCEQLTDDGCQVMAKAHAELLVADPKSMLKYCSHYCEIINVKIVFVIFYYVFFHYEI